MACWPRVCNDTHTHTHTHTHSGTQSLTTQNIDPPPHPRGPIAAWCRCRARTCARGETCALMFVSCVKGYAGGDGCVRGYAGGGGFVERTCWRGVGVGCWRGVGCMQERASPRNRFQLYYLYGPSTNLFERRTSIKFAKIIRRYNANHAGMQLWHAHNSRQYTATCRPFRVRYTGVSDSPRQQVGGCEYSQRVLESSCADTVVQNVQRRRGRLTNWQHKSFEPAETLATINPREPICVSE